MIRRVILIGVIVTILFMSVVFHAEGMAAFVNMLEKEISIDTVLSEYVSCTGSLTVRQADSYLPGRGLDVEIVKVYTVPAVFSTGFKSVCAEGSVTLPNYEDGPYYREYECPPVGMGNGWQLNFPWIGGEYIHYLDGTMYKKGYQLRILFGNRENLFHLVILQLEVLP